MTVTRYGPPTARVETQGPVKRDTGDLVSMSKWVFFLNASKFSADREMTSNYRT